MRFKLRCFGKVLLVLVGIAVLGWMVMTLWNWVVPALFIGGRSIDYLHAMGLLILSRILFGGFRGHGGCHGRRRWRRWERMTPEERENFQKNLSSADGKRREDQA
ncbi:hypothetical protein R69927_02312 [Paraburkholderia domus]|jgi:hypothetical protein|uniref:Uncharacterized protein n=1 Tax=Paraburkholderia domus TaxID=2793075 RepID=A0A9N8N3G4_9BURK|nr:hypothetical protein [Paraburkholderia domus]MBK5049509.1 hypothetical protein [Burkholderia sp. R-70006]MBK5087181.1 hypothetical protein [Burkholderia sp. R-69927]MBK5166768.1 hypothetical protein [Burkholderia sp. R-70211]MBK5180884.1 hypothetical protein [Burkholderia sp. R-69749]MCI0148294.1 hypothetical protein [Paraburkholderia sediminicola]